MAALHEARFYGTLSGERVRSTLCPHDCIIAEGGRGACGVRYDDRGRLYILVYDKVVGREGGQLGPILDAIRLYRRLGVWIEVTTLVVPGLNDTAEELTQIAEFVRSVGAEVPWHVTAFYPAYRMMERLPTSIATPRRGARLASRPDCATSTRATFPARAKTPIVTIAGQF